METLTGYVPGMSSAQAADRPLSRADEDRTPKQLRDMLQTKEVMLANVKRCSDDEYYNRNIARYTSELEAIQLRIQGLELNRNEGPQRIAKLEHEIASLKQQITIAENKAEAKKLEAMIAEFMAMGIDPSTLGM